MIKFNSKKAGKWIFSAAIMTAFATSLLLSSCSYFGSSNNSHTSDGLSENNIVTDVGFEVFDREEPLEIEKIVSSDRMDYNYIYDYEYYDIAFGNENVTAEMLYTEIDKNDDISNDFKKLLKQYVDYFVNEYPKADLRILYNNVKSLKVVECKDKLELLSHTLSADSYACYMRSENVIYTLADYDYVPGTWDYQVIMHEISHAARTYWRDTDDDGSYNIKVQFEGLGIKPVSVSEAINSIFAVRMYDKEERDIAYQLQSNYFLIILDSVDNYKLDDYINHSMSYLASKLDEAGGYNNYATVIFDLMEVQYKDYHSDTIEIAEKEFYPIYDFVSDLYYNKYLKKGMSQDEMTALCDKLVDAVTFDVPAEYHIDKDYFYLHLDEYAKAHGLIDTSESETDTAEIQTVNE